MIETEEKVKTSLSALHKIEDPNERYKRCLEEFTTFRQDASGRVIEYMDSSGMGINTLSRSIQVDPGGMSRVIKGALTVPLDGLVRLSYNCMVKSCHEVMFGTKAATMLPKHLGYIAMRMTDGTAAQKNDALTFAMRVFDEERKAGTLVTDTPCAELVKERIKEIAADCYIAPMYLLGTETPVTVKVSLRKYLDTEGYMGNISTIMYYAFELNTSLDYFISANYAAYTKLAYQGARDKVDIKDGVIEQFFSKYLSVSEQGKRDIFAHVFKTYCK